MCPLHKHLAIVVYIFGYQVLPVQMLPILVGRVVVSHRQIHIGTFSLCDGSAHSSGCVVNGSNAMAAV